MAGDVRAAGDMVAQFTEIATRARRPQGAGEASAGANTAAAQQPAAAKPSDAVAFTETASALKQAERALEGEPVVDSARVDRIRSALADGSYEVDAQRVADKMVDMESSLSGERS